MYESKREKITVAILVLLILCIVSSIIIQNENLNKIADADEGKIEAATATTNSEWDYWEYNGEVRLEKYKITDATSVEIPSVIDGYTVTKIGGNGKVFEGCNNISNITIPNTITAIWSQAFEGCSKLTSITIPDSVTSMSSSVFRGCTSLTSLIIPDSVTSIDGSAFYGCTNLTNIQLPNTLTNIGDSAFYECTNLTSVQLPNTLISIGDLAFSQCSNLTSIIIPDSVTSIGNSAFFKSTKLTSINIPNKIKKIPSSIFEGCSALASITIPDSVVSIENRAFRNCSTLTNITIPDSVTNIGNEAFFDCNTFTEITIPTRVEIVSNNAFNNCDNLTKVKIPYKIKDAFESCINLKTIEIIDEIENIDVNAFRDWTNITNIIMPDSVISIGNDAFYGCRALENIKMSNNLTSIGEFAFYDCRNLQNIIIPNRVTSIGMYAFGACSALTSIEIPDSVTSIGESAFYDCSRLTKVTMPGSGIDIKRSIFNQCINLTDVKISGSKANIDLECFINNEKLKSIEISYGVTSIGDDIFNGCSALTSIEIPNSVTSIGQMAFYNCSGLTSIEIPNSVTNIGQRAFYNCIGLTSIKIPDGVTNIGQNAFYNCIGLTSIEVPDSVTNIGEGVFGRCKNVVNAKIPYILKDDFYRNENIQIEIVGKIENIDDAAFSQFKCSNIILPDSVKSIGNSAFNGCSKLTNIMMPEGITTIGDSAFQGCTSLPSIEIPNSVTTIGQRAFRDCSGLTSITIPNNVTNIDFEIFYGCNSLENVIIPNSVTNIGDSAFYECANLQNIEIPDGIASIGKSTFYGCTSLTNIQIPNSVKIIDNDAFGGCSGLTNITIPNSVTSIGDYAFSQCNSLTKIEIPNGVTRIGRSTFYGCTSLENITIPDSVTSIGDYAFSQCNNLTKIEIPDSVTEIGANTFAKCENLTIKCSKDSVAYQYVVDNNMQYEVAIEDMNYHESETGGIVIDKIEESKSEKVEIPSQLEGNPPKIITEIDSGIFIGKENIKSVVIPDSINKIAEDAFPENTQITIECNTESYAEQYAKEHNMNYELIDKTISKISIKMLPNKVNYFKEDTELNITGGKLLLTYTDDTTSPISIEKDGVHVSGFTAGVVGGQTINVIYKENETTFRVNVIEVQNHESETGGLVVDKIEKGENEEAKVEIPSEINGKPVTEIGSGVLEGNEEVTTVVIPENVEKIAEDAFPEDAQITLEVKSDSYAEQYAKEHDMNYEYTDKAVAEISIKTLPDKIKYQKEDTELDLTGGRLLLKYSDNTTSPISMKKEGIKASALIIGQKGKQIISIEYKQKQTTFEIEVTGMKYGENESGEVIINKIENENKEEGNIETKVEVPSEVNGKSVTEIGSGALEENEKITTVVIPEGITKIAEDAFPKNTEITIECKSGSYAEQYAKEHDINYEYTDKTVAGISMKVLPNKIKYAKEDTELNLTGGRILLTYTDETTSPISMKKEGINTSGFEAGKVGNQTIKVEYKEKETSFQIKVVDNVKNHETEAGGVAIDKIEKDKTEGEEGKNEETKVEVPSEINGKPVTEIGSGAVEKNEELTTIVIPESVTKIAEDAFPENIEITLEVKSNSYAEQYAKEHDMNYEYTDKTVAEISMKVLPNKIKYAKEDTELNLTGGRILLTYTDETTSPISIKKEGINISGFEAGKVGNQTIKVEYKEKETSFQIKVVDNIKNHETETGGVAIDKIEQNKTEVEEGQKQETKVEVPSEINGKPVTEIGSGAVEGEKITTIVIPESVTKIAEDAFPENTEMTLEVKSGTYAEQYAKEHDMNYEYTNKIISGISIKTIPNKIKYQEKDTEIDLSGGRLLLTYEDNTTSPISMKKEGITVSGFIVGQKGKQIISIEYKQKQTTFEIEVTGVKYEENESGGVTINKVEQNSTGTDNENKNIKVEIPTEINGKPVTEIGSGAVEGEEITTIIIPESVTKIAENAFPKNAEITLEVKSNSYAEQYAKGHDMNYELTDKKIASISIKTLPDIIEYVKEETKLDLTGGRLLLTYTDNTTSPISMKKEGIKTSGFIVGKEGKQIINIAYKEKQTSFEINVIGGKGQVEKGDTNLDGKVDATDLLLVKRHIISGSKVEWILKEEKFKAGDINDDGKIDATDLLLVKRKILSSKV